MPAETNPLTTLSQSLADAVQHAAPSLVRVDDGTRLTATGVVWSADGLVVTTSHGTETDDGLFVETHDGTRLPATLVGRDGESDIALLRVTGGHLTPLTPAGDADARVGALALALGRPGEAGLQATLGIVSARMDAQSGGQPEFVLHTDAALYPGFSGGALLSADGGMLGLLNLGMGRGAGVALGAGLVAHVVDALLSGGAARRGYLGVSAQSVALPDALRQKLNIEHPHALLLVSVGAGSPAEIAGLYVGDIVLAVNENALSDADALRRFLRTLKAGETVTLTLVRGGALATVSAVLGAHE